MFDKIRQEYMQTHNCVTRLHEKVNDYTIFTFFLGREVGIGEVILSPLRIDHTPTFNLYYPREPRWEDQIMFKDFHGENGNVFRFAQMMAYKHYGFYPSTLQEICDFISWAMQIEYKPITLLKSPEPVYKELRFKSMPYRAHHKEYWNDLGVTEKILDLYDVRAVKYLMNECDQIIQNLVHTVTFVYVIYDQFKLYQPYMETFKNKFLSKCPREYVQGFLQCKGQFDRRLIVTKAMKDILVMQSHLPQFEDIIAPHGEGYILSDELLEWILQYKEIIIVFDYDLAGVKGARRLKKQLLASTHYSGQKIIVRFVSTTRICREGKCTVDVKDSADYRLIFGKERTHTMLNNLIYGTKNYKRKDTIQGSGSIREPYTLIERVEESQPGQVVV